MALPANCPGSGTAGPLLKVCLGERAGASKPSVHNSPTMFLYVLLSGTSLFCTLLAHVTGTRWMVTTRRHPRGCFVSLTSFQSVWGHGPVTVPVGSEWLLMRSLAPSLSSIHRLEEVQSEVTGPYREKSWNVEPLLKRGHPGSQLHLSRFSMKSNPYFVKLVS